MGSLTASFYSRIAREYKQHYKESAGRRGTLLKWADPSEIGAGTPLLTNAVFGVGNLHCRTPSNFDPFALSSQKEDDMRLIIKCLFLSTAILIGFIAWNKGGLLIYLSPWKVAAFALVQGLLLAAGAWIIHQRKPSFARSRLLAFVPVTYLAAMLVGYDVVATQFWNQKVYDERVYSATDAPVAVTTENYQSFTWRRIAIGKCGYVRIVELEFLDHETVLESSRTLVADRSLPLVYLTGDWKKLEIDRQIKRFSNGELRWSEGGYSNRQKLILAGRKLMASGYYTNLQVSELDSAGRH